MYFIKGKEGNINITVFQKNRESDSSLLLAALMSNSCIIKCLMSTVCDARDTLA